MRTTPILRAATLGTLVLTVGFAVFGTPQPVDEANLDEGEDMGPPGVVQCCLPDQPCFETLSPAADCVAASSAPAVPPAQEWGEGYDVETTSGHARNKLAAEKAGLSKRVGVLSKCEPAGEVQNHIAFHVMLCVFGDGAGKSETVYVPDISWGNDWIEASDDLRVSGYLVETKAERRFLRAAELVGDDGVSQ